MSGRGPPSWTQVSPPIHRTRRVSAFARPCVLTALLCPADDLPKKRPAQIYKPSNPDTLAYLDFSVSTTGMLAGVKVRAMSTQHGSTSQGGHVRGDPRGGVPGTRSRRTRLVRAVKRVAAAEGIGLPDSFQMSQLFSVNAAPLASAKTQRAFLLVLRSQYS